MKKYQISRQAVLENFQTILLRRLSKNPLHGYGLRQEVRDVYGYDFYPRTFYDHLKIMERRKLVASRWDRKMVTQLSRLGVRYSRNIPIKIYEITGKGMEQLTNSTLDLQLLLRSMS